MKPHDLDPTCSDADDFPAEAAYDAATLRHQQRQALEDRYTGAQLEPMPSFDEWVGGADAES